MSKPIRDIELYNALDEVESVLRRDGWCQGEERDAQGRRCAGNAVYEAARITKKNDMLRYAMLVAITGKRVVPTRAMIDFNDDPSTTFEAVVERIRAAKNALVG
jgi:hypothetical protein